MGINQRQFRPGSGAGGLPRLCLLMCWSWLVRPLSAGDQQAQLPGVYLDMLLFSQYELHTPSSSTSESNMSKLISLIDEPKFAKLLRRQRFSDSPI